MGALSFLVSCTSKKTRWIAKKTGSTLKFVRWIAKLPVAPGNVVGALANSGGCTDKITCCSQF